MIQTKTVDITPMKITLPVIEMSQYDLGREVIIHMKDGSDWFDLTGYTAKLQGTKPSGFGYTVDGVVDGHDITFASNYDMTSEAGFIPSEVRLTKNGVSLGSLNVILHVEKTPHDVTVTDGSPETIIPEMTVLVERAEAAAEVLLDCSAIATTLPAGSNATASYDVDDGVFTFGIPRGATGAKGDTGDTGNGIASITKTGTSGLVDTYTITYTDGTTTTFTVTNGQNGTGSVADVWQNGVSVLDGTVAKVVADANVQSDWNESDTTDDAYIKNKPSIPTKTSDLTNDSNFASDSNYVHTDNNFTTALKNKLDGIASGAEVNVNADWDAVSGDAQILNKPAIPTVPSNVSAFTNDAGYITTETDPTVPSWAKASSKPTYTASEVGAATADHTHGNITNGGDITASATIANGDRLVINDESASKVTNSSITFGTVTNTYLRNNGTWGAPKTSTTASLTVAGWSSSTQTVTVTGVTTTNDVIVSPAPASYDAYVSAGIRCTAQASNSLTFTCTATPSVAITVNVLIIL